MRSLVFVVAVLGALNACNCGGPVCGAGTHLSDGACVANPVTGEGEGEGGEGEGGGPVVECGPGTTLSTDGTHCNPACSAPQVYDATNNVCACPPGTLPNNSDGCDVNPALCASGTLFDTGSGTCVPVSADARGDDETNEGNPIDITLPADGDKPLEIGGVIDAPQAGVADTDAFVFQGTAGEHLQISVVSFGAPAGSFLLAGVPVPGDTTNLGGYQRFGLAAGNRTAFREVILPLDGEYEILVSDVSTFAGGVPTGSPDYT
ncbi:MAG TPA: hypothetical protein VGO62_03735, partial [Myxococcota bacterium]